MEMRQANGKDIPFIMKVIEEGRTYLKKQGLNQWQGEYPAQEDIRKDVDNGSGYVLTIEEEVSAYIAVIFGEEPAYTRIKNGTFSNEGLDYVTTHRIAISDRCRGQGLTKKLFQKVFELGKARGYKDFRVDTLAENRAMRHVFVREGYVECGLVQINGERVAYQKEFA